HFHAAGGLPFVIRELLDAGLLHEDVHTINGTGLRHQTREPFLEEGNLVWRDAVAESNDKGILSTVENPFSADGGLKLVQGNLGRAVVKVSAVKPEFHKIEAPAVVFTTQDEFIERFKTGELEKDFVAVVTYQGPRANGMPELHKLTPYLGLLQDKGFKVALVTDGRMSGASGKVLAAIQVTPEALGGGCLGLVQDGDPIVVDSIEGTLELLVDESKLQQRTPQDPDLTLQQQGMGRELFGAFRSQVSGAEQGGSVLGGGWS
ncbi:MAG: dihydroxy-acid dehydratase, partial [Pseudomonadota bacterium]